MMAQRIL